MEKVCQNLPVADSHLTCYTTNVVSIEQPIEGLSNLSPEEKLFVALVASGWPYTVAAVKAGWEKTYGWQKMQLPHIRDAVRELCIQSPDEILKAEIGAELTMMRRRAAEGDCSSMDIAEMELRLKLCMAHAKYAGIYVDKKQIDRRSVDLSLVSVDVLQSHLGAALEGLEPGTKRAIEERMRALATKGRKKGAQAITATSTEDVQ